MHIYIIIGIIINNNYNIYTIVISQIINVLSITRKYIQYFIAFKLIEIIPPPSLHLFYIIINSKYLLYYLEYNLYYIICNIFNTI